MAQCVWPMPEHSFSTARMLDSAMVYRKGGLFITLSVASGCSGVHLLAFMGRTGWPRAPVSLAPGVKLDNDALGF